MSFSNASAEVREMATKYINQFHQHLANARIEYLFTDKPIRKKGKERLGEMKLVSGLNSYLATRDLEEPQEQMFVMIINRSTWDLLVDRPDAREALVDHELAHADRDVEGVLSLNPHDIEEFNAIVERHGAWMKDISDFMKAVKSAGKTPMLPFDLSIARENQERDRADRDQREHEGAIEGEKAASETGTKPRVRKGRAGQVAAASGE